MSTYPVTKRMRSRFLGTSLAELPVGLWVIFVGMGMPLLCLMLTSARYLIFTEAARQAADLAAQTQIYALNSNAGPTGSPSPTPSTKTAISSAQDQALAVAAKFTGLYIDPEDVNCWIVITPLSAGNGPGNSTVIGPNTPLSSPPDPTQNLYQLRVDIKGQIQPIVSFAIDPMVSIPGINAPMIIKTSVTRVFENPIGLYQMGNVQAGGS